MRKKIVCMGIFIFLSLLSLHFIFSFFSPPFSSYLIEVHLNFFDNLNGGPIEGLKINFAITTNEQEFLLISGVSDNVGTIIQTIPKKNMVIKPLAINISISGLWVLVRAIGEKVISISDNKWAVKNFQSFNSNVSEYIFDEVGLRQEKEESKIILKLDFYLMPASIIEIYDPIPEASSLDSHLRIQLLSCNFVKFNADDRTMIVTSNPLQIDLIVNYVVYSSQPLKFRASILVDIGNRTFIDLTPYFITAFSIGQTEELYRILDYLSPYGFDLSKYRNELNQINQSYDLAIRSLEENDYDALRIYIRSAMNSFRELCTEITGIYTNGIVWIPSLIMIFIFFSLSLSKMITEKRNFFVIIFFVLLIAVLCLFIVTQPYLRLFFNNPFVLVQSFTQSLIFQFLFQLLPIVFLTVISFFGQIRTFLWETFEMSIRNLKRRKLKTILALSTIIIISTSAMCLITITTDKQTFSIYIQNAKPLIDRGLVIYKMLSQMPLNPEEKPVVSYIPIQQYEVKWFLEHEWVEAINVYGLGRVNFTKADDFMIRGFNEFNLIVINTSFIDHYQKASDVFGIKWFESVDKNMVIVGSRIAEEYMLEIGSKILINGKKYSIKSIVDEKIATQNLKEIDGDFFFFNVYDQSTGNINSESFIIGDVKDFAPSIFSIYKISIIMKSEYTQKIKQIENEIQNFGFDFGESDDYSYTETYSMRVILSNSIYIMFTGPPAIFISGQTPIIPIIITILMLFVNMMGTVYERKSEIHTIHIIGASPIRIGLNYITEGLVLGIIGGISSYIFGFLFIQSSNLLLPSLIAENLIGGTPFFIAISLAVISTLLGCLYPSREAIKVVVPSGRMRQQTKEILKIQEGIAQMPIPIKIDENEKDKFKNYLEKLAREVEILYKYINISSPRIVEKNGITSYIIDANLSVKGYEPASFLVTILATPNKSINVTIEPLSEEKNKIRKWNRKHKENIYELSKFLRIEILKFRIN